MERALSNAPLPTLQFTAMIQGEGPMCIRSIMTAPIAAALAALVGLFSMTAVARAQQPVTIRAAAVLDGKGGVLRNAIVAVDGSRIVKVGNGAAETATYDFPRSEERRV